MKDVVAKLVSRSKGEACFIFVDVLRSIAMVTPKRNMALPVVSEAKPNPPLNWYQDHASTRLVRCDGYFKREKCPCRFQILGTTNHHL